MASVRFSFIANLTVLICPLRARSALYLHHGMLGYGEQVKTYKLKD